MCITLDEAIQRLPLNLLARRLGVAGEIPDRDGKTVRCFFPDRHAHGDRNPSFNFYEGLTRFKCHGCGIQGRGPDLVALVLGLESKEAIRRFVEMAGGIAPDTPSSSPKSRKLHLPDDLRPGTEADHVALASLRCLDPHALALADGMGILRFGTVRGFPCWIVTDESYRVAEARRMDGKLFPVPGSSGERKPHTLSGSDKSWPVGLRPWHRHPELFRRIAIVEGGPDLLAAYHFLLKHEVFDMLPVAMLGRECRTMHPAALEMIRARPVKIYPHADADDGGLEAARRWTELLVEGGVTEVTGFSFAGLRMSSGNLAKDLNDCVHLCPDDQPELGGLFS